MASLHIDENTEIGNTGITLKELLSNTQKLTKRIACFGFSGSDATAYGTGDPIPFYNTIINSSPDKIITYSNGIIDILGLEKGKHYLKISTNVWVFCENVAGADRPWMQVIDVNRNITYAECISHFSTYYHSMIISDVIIPWNPHSDGIMRLWTKVYTGNQPWYINRGAGGYYNNKNIFTIEILELK